MQLSSHSSIVLDAMANWDTLHGGFCTPRSVPSMFVKIPGVAGRIKAQVSSHVSHDFKRKCGKSNTIAILNTKAWWVEFRLPTDMDGHLSCCCFFFLY
ncbi:hypothetical protein SDJN03_24516, partial [Cucurbita argyrosperma subsp. sororia]